MLAGDGMSQVTKTLLDLTQRKNFYAGDLLVSVEILRNVTDTFKRASYIPASDGVQVREMELEGQDQYRGDHNLPPTPRHQCTYLGGMGLKGRNVCGFIERFLLCIM